MIDPKKGIARLKEVLCLRDERDLIVIVGWALAALSPVAVHGPGLPRRAGLDQDVGRLCGSVTRRSQRGAAPSKAEGCTRFSSLPSIRGSSRTTI